MNPLPAAPVPTWICELATPISASVRTVIDHVWENRCDFIRWPCRPEVFRTDCIRRPGFVQYTQAECLRFRAVNHPVDPRSNGPAVMAYLLAGGERPDRERPNLRWSIHHIYDGNFPREGQRVSTRAVAHPLHFTNAAGLVAIHPVADALAGEFAYFAWLLRHQAFVRFQYDPDGVFAGG